MPLSTPRGVIEASNIAETRIRRYSDITIEFRVPVNIAINGLDRSGLPRDVTEDDDLAFARACGDHTKVYIEW